MLTLLDGQGGMMPPPSQDTVNTFPFGFLERESVSKLPLRSNFKEVKDDLIAWRTEFHRMAIDRSLYSVSAYGNMANRLRGIFQRGGVRFSVDFGRMSPNSRVGSVRDVELYGSHMSPLVGSFFGMFFYDSPGSQAWSLPALECFHGGLIMQWLNI